MAESVKGTAGNALVSEEMKKMEWEPLLPVEKSLLGWSVGIGAGLLGFLYWLSVALFPGGH
jgi:hypothetical protein